MTAAVEHVQSKESKLCLKSKEWLDGSRGFGPVDYSVHLEDFVLLVCEAKKKRILRKVLSRTLCKCIVLWR